MFSRSASSSSSSFAWTLLLLFAAEKWAAAEAAEGKSSSIAAQKVGLVILTLCWLFSCCLAFFRGTAALHPTVRPSFRIVYVGESALSEKPAWVERSARRRRRRRRRMHAWRIEERIESVSELSQSCELSRGVKSFIIAYASIECEFVQVE